MAAISKIHINGFKAFPDEFTLDIDGERDGKNLLMYGENGSGKSSIYYALHCMFQSQCKDKGSVYFNPDPNSTESIVNKDTKKQDAYVELEFHGDTTSYKYSRDGYTETPKQPTSIVRDLNGECVFINHKFLFNLFCFRNSQYIDLFPVFIKDILPFVLTRDKSEFISQIYDEVMSGIKRHGKSNQIEDAYIKRINRFNDETENVIRIINQEAGNIYNTHFRNEEERNLKITLEYADNRDKVPQPNKSYWLRCGYRYQYVTKAGKRQEKQVSSTMEVLQPSIILKVEEQIADNTFLPIEKPQTYFNVAKLTAIALSIRFALLDTVEAANGRFLALDDMLISLDMSNRAKVVKFLLEISDRYKIYLFTHDRMFFEYFKHKTKRYKDQWIYKEIYMDDSHRPYMRNSKSYIEEAEHYIKQHKYEIAGNFLRKAAEAFCKSFLPAKKQLSADYSRLDLNGMIVNCKEFAETNGLTNLQLFDDLDEHRKFILNPASHDSYDVEKYRFELDRCLETLKQLDKIAIRPFLRKGTKLKFTFKTPTPQSDEYKFEIVLSDEFNVIEQPGEVPVVTKGMINYKISINGIVGKIQSDNTTLKRFYDKNYDKSDKVQPASFLDGIKEVESNNTIRTLIQP